jgi:hypothetical protein
MATDWSIQVDVRLPIAPPTTALGTVAVANFSAIGPAAACKVVGVVARTERGLEIEHLAIERGSESVTSSHLRSIPIGEIIAQVRAAVSPRLTPVATEATPAAPCACGCVRHGRNYDSSRYTGMTDAFLRDLSLAYLEEFRAGHTGILRRLAIRYDRPMGTIRGWVKRARRDGWLSAGSQGRPGSEPGARLLAACKTDED